MNRGSAILAAILLCGSMASAAEPDYSKEAAVIQTFATTVSFSADGARESTLLLSVKIQSEAAVRQYGVLAFNYDSSSEEIKVDYVRVKKPDGTVVETPASSILDVGSEVATIAPTYSDIRQKQIPVKGLGTGDTLEYSIRGTQAKPEIPSQFWYSQTLIDGVVILNETLEIRVPKEKYVQVSSPKLKPQMHDENGQRVYLWTHSHLDPIKPVDNKTAADADDNATKIQVTTFHSWNEVGAWWSALASPQITVTPALEEKARQLTAGLTTDSDKAKAIYAYVAMKFRYISISLGAGKYRPHTAAEVFSNQYGDCKDKHTLFSALLKAAGVQAWPALMAAGLKFDENVPSPAQFNHVITVIPQSGGKYLWLDTTAEVAPFGFLWQVIRDSQALVIPPQGNALLVKTPADPPFKTSDNSAVTASLTADGTLTAHFTVQLEGDSGVIMRTAFRQLAPAQWQVFVQNMSYSQGYAGDVSGVEIENLEDPDKPFQYSYDYTRKDYSDWSDHHQITFPLPGLLFGPGDEADKPKEPFWAGTPGISVGRSSIQLPKGFTAQLPSDTKLSTPFADYSSHYTLKDGTITVERTMTIKQSKVALSAWEDYQKFNKSARTDQTTYVVLTDANSQQAASNPVVADLPKRAVAAVQHNQTSEARDLLSQIAMIDEKLSHLWMMTAFVDNAAGQRDLAIADCRKEVKFHPDEIEAYGLLAGLFNQAGQREDAVATWQSAVSANPENTIAVANLGGLLLQAGRYAEVLTILDRPIQAAPKNLSLRNLRVQALLKSGKVQEGVDEAKAFLKENTEPVSFNNVAFSLAEAGVSLDLARDWGQKAVDGMEQQSADASLANVRLQDIGHAMSLAAFWDTLGWAYFRIGKLDLAEKYIDAAWQLTQPADIADHLAQIYDKQGKHQAALHMWRLALASNSKYQPALDRLKAAGTLKASATGEYPGQELGELRTIKIPSLPKQTGSGEYFVLLSKTGIKSVQPINVPEPLKNAAAKIQQTKYRFPFPDDGPEKIVRRGILSCSLYTNPSCQLTLVPLETTQVASPASSTPAKAAF